MGCLSVLQIKTQFVLKNSNCHIITIPSYFCCSFKFIDRRAVLLQASCKYIQFLENLKYGQVVYHGSVPP